MRGMDIALLVVAAWGLAEATLFFVVPDVPLSFVALRSLRRALLLCLVATVAAMAGGLVMYAWGARDPATVLPLLAALPAVDGAMVDGVGRQLDESGGWGPMLLGPTKGIPYKIFAAQGGRLDLSPGWFLLATIPARLVRFVLVCLLVAGLARVLRARTSLRQRQAILLGSWVLFYTWFFWRMPS